MKGLLVTKFSNAQAAANFMEAAHVHFPHLEFYQTKEGNEQEVRIAGNSSYAFGYDGLDMFVKGYTAGIDAAIMAVQAHFKLR